MSTTAKFARTEWLGTVVRFTFRDGTVRDTDVATFSPELYQQAAMHGIEQRLRDTYALEKGASDAEKMEAFMKVYERIRDDGQWTLEREATGGMLYRAMQEAFPGKFATVEAFDEWVKTQAKAAGVTATAMRQSFERSKRIKPILERMVKDRTKGIDAEAALAKLDAA